MHNNNQKDERMRVGFITSKVYKNILTTELFSKIERVNIKYGTFEEIPLFTRYKDVEFLREYMPNEKLSEYLVHVSLFLLYDVSLYLRSIVKTNSNVFTCVTLINAEEEIDDVGFCIPNILISTKETCKFLLQGKLFNIDKSDSLIRLFNIVDINGMYNYYKTTTVNGSEQVERIYILPNKGII